MTAAQQDRYLTFREDEMLKQGEEIDKVEQESRRKHMLGLERMIENYTIDKMRTEMANDVEQTSEEARYSVTGQQKLVSEVTQLL